MERFNKWCERVFIGALLLAAIIFDAPWKATLVIAYAFASVELLPASIVKWLTRLLVGGLCALWPVWLLLPGAPGDYKPFRFVEEQARFEQDYGVPDDQNACAAYDRLLEGMDPNDRFLPSCIKACDAIVLRRPWKSDEYSQVARWLDDHQGTIDALESLVEYGPCRFPREPVLERPESSDLRRRAVRTWAYMLTIAANRKAGEGDIAEALQMHAISLRMAAHHMQQADLCDCLVGLATENMVFRSINGIAVGGAPAPDELAGMDALVAEASHEWPDIWSRIMRFECLSFKNTLCEAIYEVNPQGGIRYSRNSYPDSKGMKSPYQRNFTGNMVASGMWVFLPGSPWKFARHIDERYSQFLQIGRGDIAREPFGTRHHSRFRANHEYVLDLFMDILEPAYHRVHDLYTRHSAARRACRIILILRQCKDETGRWPESLDEVAARGDPGLWTDPLNGGSFAYRCEGDAFRLYSRGRDGIDEGGAGEDDVSFWPPRTRNREMEHAQRAQE